MRIHNSKKKEGHEMHYSELLLFSHWRDETKEFHEDSMEDCVKEYNSRKEEITENRKTLYPGENVIELLDIGDLKMSKPEHVANILDGQGEQDNEDDDAIGCIDDPEHESFGYTGNLDLKGEAKSHYQDFKYKEIVLPSNEELKYITRKLVPEQLNVLRAVVSACKAIKRSRRNPNIKPNPMRMIVHGGAGKNHK